MTLSPLLLKSLFGCVSVAGVGTAASFQIYHAYGDKPTGPGNIPKADNPDKSLKSQTGVGTDNPSESTTPPKTSTPLIPLTPAKVVLPFTTNPVVLVKAKSDFTATSKLSVESTDNDYKCKVSGDTSTLDFCKLVKLDFTKNWIDVNGIKKATSSATPLLTDLNSKDHHFKLEINHTLYDKVNLTAQSHIEIISTTTADKQLAKLNVAFKVSDAEIDYVSTKHLLGRLETAPASIDAATTHQCFLTTPTAPDTTKACSIFPFGSAQTTLSGPRYHKQTVTNLLATSSTGDLTQHNSFVVEHTTPLTKTDIAAKNTLYVKKLDNDSLSDDGKLENVVPVIIQGVTNKKAFILSESPSYSIIVKKDAQLVSDKTITHTNSAKNYQCKYDSSAAFDCELTELELSASKTSMNVADIKNTDLTSPLSIPHAESTIKFFKLDVPLETFKKITTELSTPSKTIELLEITQESVKIGTLAPLFAIDDNNVPYFQKSTFLVKNAVISGDDMPGNGAIDTTKTRHCSFSSTGTPSTTTKCELIDLGASEISAATSITDTPATSPIATANNYLVKFIDDDSASISVAQDTKGDNNMLFLQEDGADATKKLVAKFANEHIQSALVVDGDSSKKFLFIIA